MPSVDVIVASAGSGKRMGADLNKLLLKLGTKENDSIEDKGLTLLEYGLKAFLDHPKIRTIFLVVSKEDWKHLKPLAEQKGMVLVEGGKRRQDSIHNALLHIDQNEKPPDIILIQDGARIFCSRDLIERVIEGAHDKGSAIPVIPLQDTVRKIKIERGTINFSKESICTTFKEVEIKCELLDRNELFAVQTPQGFRFKDVWEASVKSQKENWEVTDDASLLEKFGKAVHPVRGDSGNLKITTTEDLAWARWKFKSA